MNVAFSIFAGATLVYILVLSWLYYAKVLRALDKTPEYSPGAQLRDIDQFVKLKTEQGSDAWYLPILKHQRTTLLIYLLVVLGFAINSLNY